MGAPDTTAFAANYTILKTNVEALRRANVADIDSLVGLVDGTTTAYKACKERIKTVRLMVDRAIEEKDAEAPLS